MTLLGLIVLFLAGGALAAFGARWGGAWPRRIALVTLLLAAPLLGLIFVRAGPG